MSRLMNAAVLSVEIAGSKPPLLLHVTTPEHFAARRIEGARNACVYEVTFLEQVREMAPEFSHSIVVYGEGDPWQDSAEAARILREAGYTNVADFRGGLREWKNSALPMVCEAPLPVPAVPEGLYRADLETSVIRWTGRNPFNHHHGHLRLSDGRIEFRNGQLRSAVFAVDLASIVCEDLPAEMSAHLIRHLHSADFFDFQRHPTARFEATRIEPFKGAAEGSANYQIIGKFTLRGVTQEIAVPVQVSAADPDHLTAQAVLEIDRTRWGSIYGSGRFFAFLGKHVVNDLIFLHLKIHAVR